MPIRHKVAAAMALPLLTFALVLGLEVREIGQGTEEVRRQTELAAAADGPSALLTHLQDERNWAAIELIGQTEQTPLLVEGYEETRRRTDEAVTGLRDLLVHSREQTRQAFDPAMDGLASGLEAVRERIDTSETEHTLANVVFGDEIFSSYSQLIEPFFAGTTQIAVAIDDDDLRQGAELIDGSAREIEALAALARSVSITSLLSEGGLNERHEISEVAERLSRFQRLARQLRAETYGLYDGVGGDELFVEYTRALTDQVDAAMRGEFDLAEMLEVITVPPEESYVGYREQVSEILRGEARDLGAAATRSERLYLLLIFATGAVALGTMLVVSRSITRPLQSLTRQAVSTANHVLGDAISTVLQTPMGTDVTAPELAAITVDTFDEIAEVATVLNTVQDSAVALAVGQAVLRRNLADTFVSLGRRNQNLLSRQLDFITELERNEVDPEALGHLFRLDHLATRMRRNAESLLVLAGNESPRRWTTPVRIADVVRAAVGEVEQYARVVVRVVEPFTVVGSAAADLTHLLAELIENALQFSPPDEPVEIRGLTQTAGYTLAIIDPGVGMSPADLARANRRLAGGEAFTVAPSKYMGHYVAGNLAVRHDIHVRLQHSTGPGTTATVHLPVHLSYTPVPM